ncbi:MAG: PHP domain-containing protein, partial [Mycoplasmatales bacterium]
MEKIVNNPLKIDLHIHSEYSKHKDRNKVESNTIENINVLLTNLKQNEINLAAITDHDYFSFELYERLIMQEEIKFLPGIEFSVALEKGKSVHVIAIFDDKDIEEIKLINEKLTKKEKKPNYDCGK